MAKVQKSNAFNTSTLERHASEYESQHLDARLFSHVRTPVVLSTTSWLHQDKFIALWINPLTTSWSLPRRESTTATAGGRMRNAWRNRYRNTYYDEFTINFTFQTGNILPSVGVTEQMVGDPDQAYSVIKSPKPPPGLVDFYRFIEMVDQPLLLGSTENRHVVFYRSRVFPRLRLEGYFVGETPLTFTESAEGNANMLQWTSTFQVYKSSPVIWSASQLIADWTNWAYSNAMPEMFPAGYDFAPAQQKIALEKELNTKVKSKPEPTKGSSKPGAKPAAAEVSTAGSSGKTIGLVAGAQKGKGKTALPPNPRDPDIQPGLKMVDGKLVPA